jgi:hypothetical protein
MTTSNNVFYLYEHNSHHYYNNLYKDINLAIFLTNNELDKLEDF